MCDEQFEVGSQKCCQSTTSSLPLPYHSFCKNDRRKFNHRLRRVPYCIRNRPFFSKENTQRRNVKGNERKELTLPNVRPDKQPDTIEDYILFTEKELNTIHWFHFRADIPSRTNFMCYFFTCSEGIARGTVSKI